MTKNTDTVFHPQTTWLDPAQKQLTDYPQLMRELSQQQIVMLGEYHDRYDIHRWQLQVCSGLLAHRQDIAVGFEMFPRRLQPVLDAWIAGEMDEPLFLEKAEWGTVWGFDSALYMPIFRFCREAGVPMLALNCHRPLVTRVGKEGWDAVPVEERDGLTPAKDATMAYREYLFAITNGGPPWMKDKSAASPEFDRFVRAQQVWDRAFACNIANALYDNKAGLIIGIIGQGHLEYGHGTPFQLRDLGIEKQAVLLTCDKPLDEAKLVQNYAKAVYRLPQNFTPAPSQA
ncbi:ChaN family lipoprotein [Pseudochrobactrum asaccharolyticum]|uniref:Putative iron-regulated protein n=1 Tax=Pseudochrobactrum asaccharolyticum TaxID=354351 RepID=A0A366E777_9HYPH|nr:ChaN family lipoprotein [Pseudochrobactrum asaccharolyticum]RBO97344.1 putative iron-regulated protein [Pseudochrobactrum asaccharolyticum]